MQKNYLINTIITYFYTVLNKVYFVYYAVKKKNKK